MMKKTMMIILNRVTVKVAKIYMTGALTTFVCCSGIYGYVNYISPPNKINVNEVCEKIVVITKASLAWPITIPMVMMYIKIHSDYFK